MKILFLCPSPSIGGAERLLLTMTAMLRKHHPEAEIAVLVLGAGPLVDAIRQQGVAVESLVIPAALERLGDSDLGGGGKLRWFWRAFRAIPGLWRLRRDYRGVVARIGPDIIHSIGIKTHLLASLARTGAIPILWHIQDFYGSRPVARKLLVIAASRMREAVAVSQAVADDFTAAVGRRPVTVILNAVDTDRFRPQPEEIVASQVPTAGRWEKGTLKVGLVATYARWKGHEVFLNAAAKILRILPGLPVQFYIIGGPIYRTDGSQYREDELRSIIGKLGISEKIQLICFQTAPERVYLSLDIVVHASTKPEPFGLTIAEAMACGKPVAASLAGGVAEIIEEGHDALGVSPGDADALADALTTLLTNADLRMRLGLAARAKIVRLFDQNRFGAQLWKLYDRVLCSENSS